MGAVILPASSYAQTTSDIIVSFEGNGIQTSSVSNSLIYSFNNLSAGTYSSVTWTNGASTVGSFSNLTIENPDQYGGSTYGSTNGTTLNGGDSTYADAIGGVNTNVATGVRLTFSNPTSFFGLWWSAGDGGNALVFYNGTNVVGSYNTAFLYSRLTNPAYFGMPTGPYKGMDSSEPFVFLNFAASNGTSFTSIVAYQSSGGGNFESDNWTVNTNAYATNGVIVENFGVAGGTAFTNTTNFIAPTLAGAAVSTNGTLLISNTVNLQNFVLLATNGSTILVGSNNPSVNLKVTNTAAAYTVGGTNYTEDLSITQTTNSNISSTLSSNSLVTVSSSTNFTLSITSPVVVGTNGGSITLDYNSVTNGSASQRLGGPSYLGSQTVSVLNVGLEVATASTTNVDLGSIHIGETFTNGTTSISNISPNTAYTETLGVSNVTSSGVSNNITTFTNLTAGSSNSYAVTLTNAAAGSNSGTIVLKEASYDTNGNLAAYSLGSQTITVTGFVYSGKSTWMSTNGGNWNSLSSWDKAGGTPGIDGVYSTNDTATFNTNGSGPVNLNTNASIMMLTFSNAASSYTISSTNGSVLTLTNGTNAPTVNTLAGSDTITATVRLASAVTFNSSTNASLELDSIVSTNNGSLIKNGSGTVILAGNNSYTGGTTLNAGTLAISNNNAFSTGTVTFSSNSTVAALTSLKVTNNYSIDDTSNSTVATFDVKQGAILTNSGVISETTGNNSGNITKTDSGTLVLTGVNTYTGITTISQGTLQLGDGGSTGNTGGGGITDNGQVIYDLSSKATNSSVIAGTGNVTQEGSGTLFLTGTNTYSGTTTIATNSALSLGTTGKLTASTNIIVNSGSSLLFGNSNEVTTNSNLTLAGGTLSAGGGTSSRAATNNFGTLTLTANSTIDFSALTNSAAFDFTSMLLGTNKLVILNWNGIEMNGTPVGTTNTPTGLFDLAGLSNLTASQLANISFYSGSNTTSGFLGTGAFRGKEIVPVPEPAVVIAGGLLLGWLINNRIRTRRRKQEPIDSACNRDGQLLLCPINRLLPSP